MCCAFNDTLLQLDIKYADLFLCPFALRDVADVALNHFLFTGLIHVADELHGDLATIPRFHRQIFVADIAMLLELLEPGLVGHNIPERAKFPDGCANQFGVGKAQHPHQERVYITDFSRFGFEY